MRETGFTSVVVWPAGAQQCLASRDYAIVLIDAFHLSSPLPDHSRNEYPYVLVCSAISRFAARKTSCQASAVSKIVGIPPTLAFPKTRRTGLRLPQGTNPR